MASTIEELAAACKGKHLLVVGAGYEGKKGIFETLKQLGIVVVLVDKVGTYAQDLVDYVLDVDTSDAVSAPDLAVERAKGLAKQVGFEIGGIFNFWENDVSVAAEIGTKLGLPCNSAESGKIAKSKHATRAAMSKVGLPVPGFQFIKTEADLEEAMKKIPFPAVLKPVFGACAQGAVKVESPEQTRAAFAHNLKVLNPEFDSIYTHGVDHVFEQYLDGDEVDCDILIQDGKVIFTSITDNLPTHEPDFINTGSNLPSILPAKKLDELATLAARTAVEAVGLTTGAAHIEMKYTTKTGPQIIEVNGRMCGNPFPGWIEAVWGIDLAAFAAAIALGVKVNPIKPAKPLTNLAGSYVLSDAHAFITEQDLEMIHGLTSDPRVFEAHMDYPAGYELFSKGHGREQLGYITCKGSSMRKAVEAFEEITDPMLFPLPEYYIIVAAAMLPHQHDEIDEDTRRERRASSIADGMFESVRRRRGSSVVDS